MKTQADLCTRLTLTTASLTLALASMILSAPASSADVLSHYQPQGLIKAERALEQGNPDRALVILHNQRAILGHQKFRAAGQSLACEAYFQKREFAQAEDACNEAVAQGHQGAMAAYLNNRGTVRLAQGRHQEALKDFQGALERNPGFDEARWNASIARQARQEQGADSAGLAQISLAE